jgi:hypothetical protein
MFKMHISAIERGFAGDWRTMQSAALYVRGAEVEDAAMANIRKAMAAVRGAWGTDSDAPVIDGTTSDVAGLTTARAEPVVAKPVAAQPDATQPSPAARAPRVTPAEHRGKKPAAQPKGKPARRKKPPIARPRRSARVAGQRPLRSQRQAARKATDRLAATTPTRTDGGVVSKTQVDAANDADASAAGFRPQVNNDFCETCGTGGSLLCCEACYTAYHLHCLEPARTKAPAGHWVCFECLEQITATSTAER